jgi:hypothetical protein
MPLPRLHLSSMLAKTAAAALAMLALGAIAVALMPASRGASASATSLGTPTPVPTVTATLIGKSAVGLRPGTLVRSAILGQRVFPNAIDGFALAHVGGGEAATYPAASVNRGKRWRVDGPPLWVAAADAPAVVFKVGAANRKTFFAWGGPGSGGQVVDVTSDAGKHWYQAALGDELEAVVSGPKGELVAFAQVASGSDSTALTWVYISKDHGRHWHYSTSLGA